MAAGTASASTARYLILNTISSYLRMAGTLAVGVLLTRWQVSLMTPEGYGVFVILMSNVGLINIIQVTTRSSLIRELSDAHHSGDAELMADRFSAATAASVLLAAVVTAAALLLTPVMMRFLVVPPEFERQVFWSWITLGVTAGLVVLTAPHTTLLGAIERIALTNVQMFAERALALVGAVFVFLLPWGKANPLLAYILAESAIIVVTRALFGWWGHVLCPTARFSLARVRTEDVLGMLRSGRHVVMLEISTNFYERVNQLVINLMLGPIFNSIFAIATLLMGYAKQIATGLCYGVEPLAARFSRQKDAADTVPQMERESALESALEGEPSAEERLAERSDRSGAQPVGGDSGELGGLILTMTRVQAGIVLPVIALMAATGHPLVTLWLEDRVEKDYPGANALIANLLIVFVLGNPFFIIMQGTLRILLGAGRVATYASTLMIAGVVQTIVAAGALAAVKHYGPGWGWDQARIDQTGLFCVAGCMSAAFLLTYGVYLPRLACRICRISARDMYIGAMLPGILVSLIPVGVTLLMQRWVSSWTVTMLAVDAMLSGALSAGAFWAIVLRSNERQRLLDLVRRRG